ncbi:MAG: hypothetical protein P4L84_32140 [Isosphaeraceae bacterium]|nr:hypothetical protein [Isosphaeraceae bacterium]
MADALAKRGLEVIRIDELGTGLSITDLIRESIGRSDYLIAVMGEKPNGNVLFELGMAAGMGKHVLVLASHPGEFPLAASGLSYLKADPKNREAIEFGLDQLLSAPNAKSIPHVSGDRETHAIGDSADRLLDHLQAFRGSGAVRESQLIDIIYDAVEASGVSTVSKESRGDAGRIADLAVWSDDLEPWIGNPLVVEVKRTLSGRKDLETAVVEVSTMLDQTRSPYGLLLYLTAKPAILYGGPYDPRVMVMSIEEFIGGLRDAGLGELLRRTRNDIAHARG